MCGEDPGMIARAGAWDFPSSVSIRGIVVPSAWDSKGNVTQVAICCPDEKEYKVRREGLGLVLEQMMRLCVEVKGQLVLDGEKGHEILVEQYRKAD